MVDKLCRHSSCASVFNFSKPYTLNMGNERQSVRPSDEGSRPVSMHPLCAPSRLSQCALAFVVSVARSEGDRRSRHRGAVKEVVTPRVPDAGSLKLEA